LFDFEKKKNFNPSSHGALNLINRLRPIPQFTDTSDTDTIGVFCNRYRIPMPEIIWWWQNIMLTKVSL